MPRSVTLSVQALGIDGALQMLEGSAHSLSDMRQAEPIVQQLLYVMYSRRWARWGEHLYETGRLRESFTDAASSDAIREAHWDKIEYGSTVPYASIYSDELLKVDAKSEADLADAMADYYAGARLVRGHVRAGVWVSPYVRRNVALARAHG